MNGLLKRLAVMLGVWGMLAERAVAEAPEDAFKSALETIFCPQRVPEAKTMGLLQRNFLDLVESSRDQLQVAIVLDGTTSMTDDFKNVMAALRTMSDDLRGYRGDRVSFALVVYRDEGAPSGPVSLPLKDFTADGKAFDEALSQLAPETGAPYFNELPDLGIHEALNKLSWSDDANTTRWLILFGDAPPYDTGFEEPETGARRRYDTDLLVTLAKRKQVQISCILSTSRPEEREAYNEVLDKTRQFMNGLSSATNGAMLDLSYPDIRRSLVDTAKTPRVPTKPIGRITRDDIEAVRRASEMANLLSAESQRVRLAVLPHLPLDQISFDPKLEAVQIAAEMRQQLRSLPRVDVKSPVEVERQLRRLQAEGSTEKDLLQSLALRLRVHYIVWGTIRRSQGIVSLKSAIYSQKDGQKLLETSVLTSNSLPENRLVGDVTSRLLQLATNQQTPPDLVAVYTLAKNQPGGEKGLFHPVAQNVESRNDLLIGFEAAEQALAFSVGSPEAITRLDLAMNHLNLAEEQDPKNPLIHLLQSQVHCNRAQQARSQGDLAGIKSHMQATIAALERANRTRESAQQEYVSREITADYLFLTKRDYPKAIEAYQALTNVQEAGRLHVALRAHWMLAGIYSGDWEVPETFIQGEKARAELIEILAHWPDSPEAAYIRRQLRWDEESGQNKNEQLPLENGPLVNMGLNAGG